MEKTYSGPDFVVLRDCVPTPFVLDGEREKFEKILREQNEDKSKEPDKDTSPQQS